MLQIKNREEIKEITAPKKTGKPRHQKIKPRYIGCLIFEYIPFVIKSPSYVSSDFIVNNAVIKMTKPVITISNPMYLMNTGKSILYES
jgi:hypothetical protein